MKTNIPSYLQLNNHSRLYIKSVRGVFYVKYFCLCDFVSNIVLTGKQIFQPQSEQFLLDDPNTGNSTAPHMRTNRKLLQNSAGD